MYLEAAKFASASAAIITGCIMIYDFIARGQASDCYSCSAATS